MKLACIQDGRLIESDYLIIGLLGHTGVKVFKPEETPLSTIVCSNHFLPHELPSDGNGKPMYVIDNLQKWNKGLVFSVTKARRIKEEREHEFSPINEYRRLLTLGDWNNTRLIPACVVAGIVYETYLKLTGLAYLSKSTDLTPLRDSFLKHVDEGGNRAQGQRVYAYEATRRFSARIAA